MSIPRVVIVGGGFGGLFATRRWLALPVNVVLIDKRNYHLFRPMLYQVATGLLSADQIAVPLRSIVSRQRNVEVLQDEVTAIDPAQRLVRLRQHRIALRFPHSGHRDSIQLLRTRRLAGRCARTRIAGRRGPDSRESVNRVRARRGDGRARSHRISAEIQQLLTFVLVGAGTVGVEMASTLAEMSRMALSARLSPYRSTFGAYSAVRSGAAHTSHVSRSLIVQSATASRKPGRRSVHEHAGHRVDEGGIVADGKRVPASTVLWGAGVLASPAARWLGAAMDRSGKIIVNADLSVPGHPEIFAIGDTAHVVAESRNLLGVKSKQPMAMPGVAQPAIQEGKYVARLIRRRVCRQAGPSPILVLGQG